MKEEFENNTSIFKFESDSDENPENAKKKSKPKINIPDLRQKLEKINENEEENYSTNITNLPSKDFIEDEQSQSQELIATLKNKIEELELKILDLKDKNEELKKNNIRNDSALKKMSFIGKRRNFNFGSEKGIEEIKIAKLLKEKNDLQEMNEKMLNMLTDKELENEELQENFEEYKKDVKKESKKFLETISNLEEKIEVMEENFRNKEKFEEKIDDVLKEYNNYKEKMEKSLKDHFQKEEELQNEIVNKENYIQVMKKEFQNLELENQQLEKNNEQRDKIHDEDLLNIDKVILEKEELKGENQIVQNKIKMNEEKYKISISSKDQEIKLLKENMNSNIKNFEKMKEEKIKEIDILNNEINKFQREINNLNKKYDEMEKENKELKEKNSNLQNKLDKKTKELQEINDTAKKLIENKDNLIQQYEEKLNDIFKDKNKLIEQNRELLDKINANNLSDILNEEEENNKNDENILLLNENKNLKYQLAKQAQELVSLNAMEKEISRLKLENENLLSDMKSLKDKIDKKKIEESATDLMNSVKNMHNRIRISKKLKTINASGLKDNKKKLEKQINNLKKTKENDKKYYLEEINKLKEDIALWKVKCLNQDLEKETIICKYKYIIKSISQQCNLKGIQIEF